ncbi:MAG TPA: hypothetical protein VG675_15575 [Bryobacteraceae bacterium]|nr:hypothetical protein [Bryobacteraceae bacterium]
MFDSLADRIKEDERQTINSTERIIRWLVIVVLSVLLFGALFLGVRMLS